MEGVARIRGKRSDALGEHAQFVDWIWHHKIRANDCLFKRKLPSVSNFVITRPIAKSAVYHPKKRAVYSKTLQIWLCSHFSHRRNTCGYRLQMSNVIVKSKAWTDVWIKQICSILSFWKHKSDTAEHTATCQKEKSLHTTLSAQCMHNLKGRCSVIGKV